MTVEMAQKALRKSDGNILKAKEYVKNHCDIVTSEMPELATNDIIDTLISIINAFVDYVACGGTFEGLEYIAEMKEEQKKTAAPADQSKATV